MIHALHTCGGDTRKNYAKIVPDCSRLAGDLVPGRCPARGLYSRVAKLDVSSIQGKWEAFMAKEVANPLPGVQSAYVVIGADKRGTIFALYDHSEQFGASDSSSCPSN